MTKELQAWKESLKEYLNEGHGTKVKGHIPKRHIFLIWSIFLSNIKLMGCKAKELWAGKGSWKYIQMVVCGSKVKGQSKVASLKSTSTWYDIYPCQIWNWSAAQPRYYRLEKEAEVHTNGRMLLQGQRSIKGRILKRHINLIWPISLLNMKLIGCTAKVL